MCVYGQVRLSFARSQKRTNVAHHRGLAWGYRHMAKCVEFTFACGLSQTPTNTKLSNFDVPTFNTGVSAPRGSFMPI
jgi:hypothetical protein